MPLPFILGAGALLAGIVGVGSGINGAAKMKDANDTMQAAESRHRRNVAVLEEQSKKTSGDMDVLGKKELGILKGFENFTLVFEKIQGKPQFKTYNKDGVKIPEYNACDIEKASVGAGVLIGGLGGAAVGAAGGFAAAGATTAAVMALGTASTGTAIASLSGAAATNATLAALGGGAIAAGGGGMAVGSAVLGAATLGIGLLVGGVIFNMTGSSLSDKADGAWNQMRKAEEEMNKISDYLKELSNTANRFTDSISSVEKVYKSHLKELKYIVEINGKTDWNYFTDNEKLVTENTVLLVNLLYNMGKVKIVLQSSDEKELNTVNTEAVNKSIFDARTFLSERGLSVSI